MYHVVETIILYITITFLNNLHYYDQNVYCISTSCELKNSLTPQYVYCRRTYFGTGETRL